MTCRGSIAALVLAGLLWAGTSLASLPDASGLPGRLGEYVTQHVKLSPEEHKRLLQGEAVTKMLPTDPAKEVSVFGAVWVNASASDYVAAVRDIERFEQGTSFLVTKKISSPPVLADFARLTVPTEDVSDLKKCKVGNCELKLSAESLQRLQKEVDLTQPLPVATAQVETAVRHLALDYVTRYLRGGNAELAAYRDTERPTFVAQEFKTMVDQMPSMTTYLTELRTYLLEYPKVTLPRAESFLYWQTVKFGLKPTTRINHVVIAEGTDGTVIASKMLYASHYFWTALELRVVVPDPARGSGFWLANVNRSRSDGLTGFVGTMVRGKVRSETQKGMAAALLAAKTRLEKRSLVN